MTTFYVFNGNIDKSTFLSFHWWESHFNVMPCISPRNFILVLNQIPSKSPLLSSQRAVTAFFRCPNSAPEHCAHTRAGCRLDVIRTKLLYFCLSERWGEICRASSCTWALLPLRAVPSPPTPPLLLDRHQGMHSTSHWESLLHRKIKNKLEKGMKKIKIT